MGYVENTMETSDKVKYFIKKYGNAFSTVVLIIILGLVGLQYWHKHETKVSQQASIAYQNLLGVAAENKTIEVQALANQLMTDYSGTPYAKLAAFMLAKQAVTENKYPLALTKLQWVVDNSKSPAIKAIATLRLARVMIENKQAQQAITLLNGVTQSEFIAEADTVKGDAYLALQQKAQAKQAYTAALAAADQASPLYSYIQMKLYSV
jgi:predicted negative regulator of RcsB-dependent stress response